MPRDADPIDAALRIGHALCADALWWDGRCTFTTDDIASTPEGWRTVHQTCGGDLYAGTAGIALFLARLSAVTGERVIARTAAGAIAHALAEAEAAEMARCSALFVGRIGIAVAAAMAGAWLDRPAALDAARVLARQLASEGVGGFSGSDLMAGWAGGIAGALVLARRLEDDQLIGWASDLGDALVGAAQVSATGWHWPARDEPVGLCGLSHGAAGIAWALAELAAATGAKRFAEAAAGAVAYEQHWFDAVARNWPDLSPESRDAGGRRSCSMSWCHGAPGIALTRLRLWALTGSEAMRAQAMVALATTADCLRANLANHSGNYSLCHGLAGNAEALLQGGTLFDTAGLAEEIAASGIRRFGQAPRSWPAGVDSSGAMSPTLMLGLAGTAYFLLRVNDPGGTPSILLPDCAMPGDVVPVLVQAFAGEDAALAGCV
ncbi:lanthionine synthetase LanC family protein [Sphingomonas qilianensis]|uniref:Lanthionine synthetase LanC family protein n=1 Tax=Sphingomonas qilianensis TaxID=1736690 RepID=A0ABU9XSH9_9SPHN